MNDTKDIIEIEYCVSCDYRARALWIATELLASFQFDIEAIVLKGASDGRFEVGFGKQRLFSKSAVGRFPDPDELRLAIFALIDAKAS